MDTFETKPLLDDNPEKRLGDLIKRGLKIVPAYKSNPVRVQSSSLKGDAAIRVIGAGIARATPRLRKVGLFRRLWWWITE